MADNNIQIRSPFASLAREGLPRLDTSSARPPAPAPRAADAAPRQQPAVDSLLPPANVRGAFDSVATEYGVPVNVLMALPIDQSNPAQSMRDSAQQIRERLNSGQSIEDVLSEFSGGQGGEVLARVRQIGEALMAEDANRYGAVSQRAAPQQVPGQPDPATSAPAAGAAEQPAGPELRNWEPGFWDRVAQFFSSPNRDAAAVEATARRIAKEQGISVNEVYRQAGGRRTFRADPEGRGFGEALRQGWQTTGYEAARAGEEAPPVPADEQGILSRMGESTVAGYENMVDAMAVSRFALGGGDADSLAEGLAEKIQRNQAREAGRTRGERESQAAFGAVSDSAGMVEALGAGLRALGVAGGNPGDTAVGVAEQSANMLPAMAGAAGGAATGAATGGAVAGQAGAVGGAIIGGRLGMAAGTAAIELGAEIESEIMDRLNETGQQPTAENIKGLLQDPEFMREAVALGARKGLTLAAVDQLFMGLSGRVAATPMRQATREAIETGTEAAQPSLGRRAAYGAAATGIESIGEGASEAAGQLAARGEIDAGEALQEGVYGFGTAVASATIGGAMETARARYEASPQARQRNIAMEMERAIADAEFVESADTIARRSFDPNAQAGATVAEPAPSGPIGRALDTGRVAAQERVAQVAQAEAEAGAVAAEQDMQAQPSGERVTVTAGDGAIEGVLESYTDDGQGGFSARVVTDDGMTYDFTQDDGVAITPVEAQQEAAAEAEAMAAAAEQAVLEGQQEVPAPVEPAPTEPAAPAEPAAATPVEGYEYRSDGRPFSSPEVARRAVRNRRLEGYEPVEVEGGWALAQTAEAQPTEAEAVADAPVEIPSRETGNFGTVTTPAGRDMDVEYRVVEATDLATSNFDDGRVNPDYPKELQPRDRSRAASQDQVRDIASRINPRLLGESPSTTDGAPIVSPAGIVESGNGRTLALRRAYGMGNAGEYRQWLAGQGYDIEGMQQPVLVRVRRTDMTPDELVEYTRESNERTTLEMSATEQAMADADSLGPIIEDYKGGDINSAANRDFVRKFVRDVVGRSERGGMADAQGHLSQEGRRRVEAALLAAAYGDPGLVTDVFESVDTEIKAIGGALLDAAGRWAQMRQASRESTIADGLDVTPNLIEAVNTIRRARAEGRPLSELVATDDMFGGRIDPRTEAFLRIFYRGDALRRARGREKVAEALNDYANRALESQPGDGLFGDNVTADQLVGSVNERLRQQEEAGRGQSDLFGAARAQPATRDAGEPGGERQGSLPETVRQPAAKDARAEPELSAEQQRRDEDQRTIYDRRVDDMTREEMKEYIEQLRAEVLVDERTGLGSNRAWLNREPKAFVASIDLDSLKWVNDNMGHAAGDRMIALVGDSMREAGIAEDSYHVSGDEFYAQADTAEQLADALTRAQQWLAGQTITEGGIEYTGPGFSYGIGTDINAAERGLHEHKQQREAEGERAARGERPAGAVDAAGRDQQRPADEGRSEEATADREGEGAERPQPDVRPSDYGASNRLVSQDRAEELRQRLRAKLNQIQSGIDPETMAIGVELAAFHIEAGARKFIDFARAIANDLGTTPENLRRYLRSWYNGARDLMEDSGIDVSGMDTPDQVRADLNTLTEESDNAQRAAEDTERDSPAGEAPAVAGDIADAGRGSVGQGTTETGAQAGEGRGAGDAVGDGGAAAAGERGNKPVPSDKSKLEQSAARDTDNRGSLPSSTGGLFAERQTGSESGRSAGAAPATIPRLNVKGDSPVTSGNLAEIKEQMPFLTEGQAQDVAFAERRFAKPDGAGVLFTNGTGTGKTFSGLGIAKRMAMAGKGNILVAVPKQTIADAWIRAGDKFFNLPIDRLKSTKDAGQGIVITTYANLGDNQALLNRDWDAVVADEAHYLSSDQKGSDTKALATLRAMTLKRGTAQDRVYAQHPDKVEKMQELYNRAEVYSASDNEQLWHQVEGLREQANAIRRELEDLTAKEQARVDAIPDADKPRAVFLSATPFSYEKSVQWANEFLFDWGTDQDGLAYNSGGNFERFMMQHFGYRMRYNKLTEPDARVDRGLMQRAFNAWLQREGVLSGRALDSEFDYDRHFILAESALGRRVDAAIEWIRARSRGDKAIPGMDLLYRKMIEGNFDYHARMYFLEAIKAREAIPHIRAHIDKGRKVLVMHDFKKGGATNPFRITPTDETRAAYEAFQAEFGDLINAFSRIPSPIDLLSREFPDALVYNGNVSAKKRVGMQDRFNSDADDSPRVMIAQGDAMREGVSIHDTTGKFPRVMIHLGMPVKPTAAIQQEGRTYRTGQASNAMFRYLTIGSSWERLAFASKIASRASAAENLAMGEQARGLKQAFIDAYENAGDFPAGFEGEGIGGRATDGAYAHQLTPWDMAKAFYFGTKQQGRGRSARGREHSEFFATPEPLGLKMVQWADVRGGEKTLEPSAGHGAIARWFPENAENRAIELTHDLSSRLALHFDGDLLTGDFMDHNIVNKYDAIVMNPPFGQGGKQAAEHVEKAMRHLRDGGRIVALIPAGPAADKRFSALLESDAAKDIHLAAEIKLPAVTFERAGTSVATRVLVLEKQTDPDVAAQIQQANRDYSGAKTTEELFDRLESSEIQPRLKPEPAAEAAPTTAADPATDAAGSMETWDATHTKTGDPVYMAKPRARLDRDQYNQVLAVAKQHGGYWSRFGKAGFLFKSAEERQAFVNAISAEEPGVRYSIAPPTDSAEFRRWFGNSKVVDEDGEPLVVYHGTAADFSAFSAEAEPNTEGGFDLQSQGVQAFFFTPDPGVAAEYAEAVAGSSRTAGDTVMPVYLSLRNPLVIDASGESWAAFQGEIEAAHNGGQHDGVILRNVEDGMFEGETGDVYAAFRPEQIKSAIGNRGAFDPNDPNILHQSAQYTAPQDAETGKPMSVFFARNTVSARGNAPAGMDFGQDIEPAGEYMVIQDSDMADDSAGWEFGTITFRNPLVLEHKNTGSTGWKKDLSDMFDGKTGRALSNAVRKAGYDGIITRDEYGYSESVNLSGQKGQPQQYNQSGPQQTASELARQLREEFPGLKLDLMGRGNRATLSRIVVPEDGREQGTGTQVMQRIAQWADTNGVTLALTPSSDFGGSKTRLNEFYKRFGFVDNKGAERDYEISETMYREPAGTGIRYSTTESAGGFADADALDQRLRSGTMGRFIGRLIDSGRVVLHDTARSMPRQQQGSAALTTLDGTIHLAADMLTENSALPVLMHEAFHSGVERLIGSRQWDGMMKRLGSLYRQGERSTGRARQFWDEAAARVQYAERLGVAMGDKLMAEEFGAYAIEQYESAPQSVRRWIDDMVGMVKAWAQRLFGVQLGRVTPAQLRALAAMAIRSDVAARAGVRTEPAFSAGDQTTTPEFSRWFGDSKVVDEDGEPLVVYHGTSADFAIFDESRIGSVTDDGWYGRGFYFTPHASWTFAEDAAEQTGGAANVMPVYLSIQNPVYADAYAEQGSNMVRMAKERGRDGVIVRYPHDHEQAGEIAEIIVWDSSQIKSAIGNVGTFDPNSPDIRYSIRPEDHFTDLSNDQKSFLSKIGPRTFPQRMGDRWRELTDNLALRVRQAGVDRYAALLRNDQALLGEDTLEGSIASSSWVLARMSEAAGGALSAMVNAGRIYLDGDQKVIDVREGTKGFAETLRQLGSPAEIDRFMAWVAANRSHRLAQEGRENLFTEDEIRAGVKLGTGKTEDGKSRGLLYAKVWGEFQQFRDDVLGIAEQAGIITPEQRTTWAEEFYVPFYRVLDEDTVGGPRSGSGLSRQQAYKRLKGGRSNLNDLLDNTLLNFHHLIQASLKNQAAIQAVDNAMELDIAEKTTEARRDKKASTFIMRDGEKEWYNINDPLTFKALSALSDAGMNNTAMKVGRAFKRFFTNMITVTPKFVIANTLRDTLSAIATSPASFNPARNVIQGAMTYGNDLARARMLASGGAFSFGHVYGRNPDEVKASLTKDLRSAKLISDPKMAPKMLVGAWRKWNRATDFAENVNRAAIWEQNQDSGKLRAAFEARDLVDFSARGDAVLIRILADLVPFLNARIQGLDKLYRAGIKPGAKTLSGRGTKADRKAFARFAAVVGALSAVSIALYLRNYDDEEYRKLEDWQRDSYWVVRIGDAMFFIPKPFEVGAIATMAERTTEQFVDDTVGGRKFAERLGHMLSETFSFDPIPQAVKPLYELSMNRNTFTGRPIEGLGDQRLSPSLRTRPETSMFAEYLSRGMEGALGLVGDDARDAALSPLQIDHLIAGYTGDVGSFAAATADTIWRRMLGEEQPAKHWYEYQPIKRFYRDLTDEENYNRYGTLFYDTMKKADRAYADLNRLQEYGELERAYKVEQSNELHLAMRRNLNRTSRSLGQINREMRHIRMDKKMSGEAKRLELDRLRSIRNMILENVGKEIEEQESARR